MIDCLYTGPATDSIDCCMGQEDPYERRRTIVQEWHYGFCEYLKKSVAEVMDRLSPWEVTRIDTQQTFGGFADLFDVPVPAKAPQSLQDRVPEKG